MHSALASHRPRAVAVAGLAALLAAAALSGCGDRGRNAGPPADGSDKRRYGRIAFDPCTLSTPYANGTFAAQCARFQVPENPAQPKGRQLSLNLAWLPATEGAGSPDPVFFLAGGPGQAATSSWPMVDAAFREVRKHRHVVLVDQRGTGKSAPLTCAEAVEGDPVQDETAALDASLRAIKRCAQGLSVDPRYFTTTEAIADLDAVRSAIGADKINLVGVSYGTRVAQQYATRYPARVRSLVLDGVAPNELVLGSEHARNLDNALALQFKLCQQTPACRARFGADPREQLRQLMARLQAAPVEIDYRDPSTGEQKRAPITAGHVAILTRMFSYAPEAAALLPQVLNEADQGRYAPLMALSKMLETQLGDEINFGMQLSVSCAEDVDLFRPDPADADTVLGDSLPRSLTEQCKAWPTGTRPKNFHHPFKSDTPALLLSGELDPVTPPRYGDQVVKHLRNGRHLILRGQGHGALRIGCTPKLLGQFLETANAKQLDARCLDSLGYVPPFVSFNGWEP
ncbi:alpha/beta hydrolase [Lysobacter sp. BMK333-48F3]|uniref:alpha/beta hydrolase n=1 Tax=Lysobacter sp. BMK333-48F3 TaxID=2867962 RepID=UPI001C8B68DC|nr:alpha/beta hydrolase [Lysobacter sp. BMK333-48F3]MBX9400986.1 alpha/beta hydrolase [Lysobacter sp. BMK333-48F3]